MTVFELCNDDSITIAIFKTLKAAKKFNDDYSNEETVLFDQYYDEETEEPRDGYEEEREKLKMKYEIETNTSYLKAGNYDTIFETRLKDW